jgi:hypothetical protein
VPLRSVEAATRDDAIAAAREQFGASARVVGVRRVRSGGVLGFFATERYVAEVDPDPAARPVVPVPAPVRGAAERRPARDDAPPARPSRDRDQAAAPSGVPARNGAAAWAAEARSTPAARSPRRDDDRRVDELAGLLSADRYEPAPFPRPSLSRPASAPEPRPAEPARPAEPEVRPAVVRTVAARPAWSELLAGTETPAPVVPAAAPSAPVGEPAEPAGGAATPSPFTAALARMVAGDRDVQQAVEDALADPADPADRRAPGTPGPWPAWSGPIAATSVTSSATHQEEEPVELQDWTPSSAPLVEAPAPAWTAPEPTPPSVASREESIAEVLRAALAEGRSDEALAGILRKVMDGAPPAVALADTPVEAPAAVGEPVAVVEPATALEPVLVDRVVAEPEPLVVEPLAVEPVVEAPLFAAHPAPVEPAPASTPMASSPAGSLFGGSDLGWDDPDSSSLWADVVAPPVAPTVAVAEEPAVDAVAVAEEPAVEETPVVEEAVLVAEPIAGQVAAVESASAEATCAQSALEEVADLSGLVSPRLARTASDPAPLSLDSTTVMPPLSLLPPLPSSRRGGRPPVPPTTRPAAASARPARPAPAETPDPPAAPNRFEALATVTRLPLVPVDDAPEPEAQDIALEETTPAPAPDTTPQAAAPAPSSANTAVIAPVPAEPVAPRPRTVVVPAPSRRPAAVVVPAPRADQPARRTAAPARPAVADGDVVSRLTALGLTEDLLGGGFADDAATHGTYAALTRALAARLPETPELPAGAGEVLVVVGPGVETLRAARALAASLRLDPDRVQWATRGDLAGLAPAGSRMATVESAIERRQEAIGSGTVTVVAVDAPLRTDAYWTAQMLAIWAPIAVWAVVEATRKPEDLEPWLEGLPRVDALMIQDTDLSADPADVLHRVALPLGLPVAVLDGVRATPHRWASLLCERLETPQA